MRKQERQRERKAGCARRDIEEVRTRASVRPNVRREDGAAREGERHAQRASRGRSGPPEAPSSLMSS